jgi:predicted phage terminase large subunit-like protein
MPLDVLEGLRRSFGTDLFSAQYQQSPVPEGGAMIKRAWVRRYAREPLHTPLSRIVQSWDTAAKAGAENDWSVCSTWHIEGEVYSLIDVVRGRYDFPTLRALALALADRHQPISILIEDVGTGTALIQELRQHRRNAIPVRPERDKITRMSIQSAKFEAGQVYLPEWAPWLAVFEAELFAFPKGKYDDQVDTVSQVLGLGHHHGYCVANFL